MRLAFAPFSALHSSIYQRTVTRPLSRQPWTCQQCTRLQRASTSSKITAADSFSKTRTPKAEVKEKTYRQWRSRIENFNLRQHRKAAIFATVIFVTGCAGLAFSERVRYGYMAVERSGRVAVILAQNVNEYRKVLKQSEDPSYNDLLKATHKRCAERTLEAMKKNGSIFIKLGQHLSSLNYLLPEEWCNTFIPLQDECPVSPFSSIDAMVRYDTGKGLEEYFDDFQREPIGAASLAQVHIAKMKDTGEKVAVKVQHPTMDDWKELDLALTRFTFRTVKSIFPEYDLTWLSDEMETSLPKELDFREEGRNAQRMQDYFERIPDTQLVIPDVKWARRRILVMEFITGHRPDDLEFLDQNGIDRDEVSATLANIFNEMIFGSGAPLHCDPHGGNIAIRVNEKKKRPHNFDVILYDHGLYRDVPTKLRRSYAHLWLAVINVDEEKMRKYAYEVAGIGDEEFPIFASAITGRDFRVVRSDITQSRDQDEKEAISDAMSSGDILEQLVKMLSHVPRIVLLILKTNDLTRSLDENLHTKQGPVRSFMILARYAARAVFQEQVEGIKGTLIWPPNLWTWTVAFVDYAKVVAKLRAYEYYLGARRVLGLQQTAAEGGGEQSGMESLQGLM